MGIDILLDDNFTSFNVGTGPNDYSYYSLGNGKVANQGSVLATPNGTVIGAMPAVTDLDTASAIEHIKWLAFRNQTFNVPNSGLLVIETTMSAEHFGVDCNPFPLSLVPNPQADPRLISASMVTLETPSLITADWFFTNQTLYALYEILPFNKPSFGGKGPDYAAFTSLVPVGCVKDFDNGYVTVGTTYTKQGRIGFLVNGEERFCVPQAGYYPLAEYISRNNGGPPVARQLESISVGPGIFTLLDGALPGKDCCRPGLLPTGGASRYYNPCAISCQPGETNPDIPQTFSNIPNIPSNRLWGQGAILNLKKQVIYTANCG